MGSPLSYLIFISLFQRTATHYERRILMDKNIADMRTGLTYELIGDYYFVAGEDEPSKAYLGI